MITLKDIAEYAGVSTCTVSQVLNGKHKIGRINEKTQKHVIEAAVKLGYRPNAIAKAIKTQRSNVFGVIGVFKHQYHLQMINGIAEESLLNGYMFNLLIPSRVANETVQGKENKYRYATKMCIEQRVAGIIVCSPLQSELQAIRTEIGIFPMALVAIDSCHSNTWCSRIGSDDIHGAEMATTHLIERGGKRVAHITANLQFGYVSERLTGYRQALKIHDITEDPKLILSGLQEDCESGNTKLIADFLRESHPDSVFCSSDYFAANVLRAAKSIGMQVPGDLLIVGYGNLMDLSRYCIPSLSSVSQAFEETGRTAVKLILDHLRAGSFEHKEIKLPVELILRESTIKKTKE